LKNGATHTINSAKEDAVKKIMSETEDGVDVAIEAVGAPATFDICQGIVRPGGHIANIGVHGHSVNLQIQDLWTRNITITMGLVNTNTTPKLIETVVSGKINPKNLITHHFKLDDIMHAYEVFGNPAKENSMKVIIEA
jgi:alcohol dehydrogenase